jgi:hypothetical protein
VIRESEQAQVEQFVLEVAVHMVVEAVGENLIWLQIKKNVNNEFPLLIIILSMPDMKDLVEVAAQEMEVLVAQVAVLFGYQHQDRLP